MQNAALVAHLLVQRDVARVDAGHEVRPGDADQIGCGLGAQHGVGCRFGFGSSGLQLQPPEEIAFATAALALRFGERGIEETGGHRPAPVTAEQQIEARRPEDIGHSLWTTFQRVQENVIRGGQPGRSVQGRRLQTRPVGSIDRGVSLNRALWMLAEEMRKL